MFMIYFQEPAVCLDLEGIVGSVSVRVCEMMQIFGVAGSLVWVVKLGGGDWRRKCCLLLGVWCVWWGGRF